MLWVRKDSSVSQSHALEYEISLHFQVWLDYSHGSERLGQRPAETYTPMSEEPLRWRKWTQFMIYYRVPRSDSKKRMKFVQIQDSNFFFKCSLKSNTQIWNCLILIKITRIKTINLISQRKRTSLSQRKSFNHTVRHWNNNWLNCVSVCRICWHWTSPRMKKRMTSCPSSRLLLLS